MTRCAECESIEGGWRDATDAELLVNGVSPAEATGEADELICKQCGAFGSYQGIPEHDWMEER